MNALVGMMDQISISFALEDETRRKPWTLSRHLEMGRSVGDADLVVGRNQLQPADFDERGGLWVQRLVLEKYFERHAAFPFEFVHRKTFIENMHLQPPVLRYALCSLCGHITVPPAPKDVVNMFMEKAKSLMANVLEDCTLENFQAVLLLSFCASAHSDVALGFTYLSLAIRMAEYLKLHEDPDDDP
ncbi:hypothetical protein HDU67_005782, partial [Dinochytrium kinnereticum]